MLSARAPIKRQQFTNMEKGETNIGALPDEILLHIFEHLDVKDLCMSALV
jgi:hypothetical protein